MHVLKRVAPRRVAWRRAAAFSTDTHTSNTVSNVDGNTPTAETIADVESFVAENFERTDINDMSVEEWVRSPIQQLKRRQNEDNVEANAQRVENKKRQIEEMLKTKDFQNAGFRFAYYQKATAELEREMKDREENQYTDPELVAFLRDLYLIDPDDAFKTEAYRVYPGTAKGPYPEDDPEFFERWSEANPLPHEARAFQRMNLMFGGFQSERKDPSDETAQGAKEKNQETMRMQMHHFFGKNMDLEMMFRQKKTKGNERPFTFIYESPDDLPDHIRTDIPLVPSSVPLEEEDAKRHILEWSLMRWNVMFKNMMEDVAKKEAEAQASMEDPTLSDPFATGYYPSIFAYYNLLPKHMREHPVVMAATVGLEKTKFELTLEQKQTLLNKVCHQCCPDPECEFSRLEGTGGGLPARQPLPADRPRRRPLHGHLERRRRLHQLQEEGPA